MSIDQDLRRILTDARHAPPAWPDAVERVITGVRRRRRRRALLAASVCAVVVLASLGVAATWRDRPVAPGETEVVPWIDAPAPVPTNIARTSPRAEGRPCEKDRFGDAWIDTRTGTGGTSIRTVLVPSLTIDRCTIRGSVRVTAVDLDTNRTVELPIAPGAPETAPYAQFPATVVPGDAARIDITTTGDCAPGATRVRPDSVTLTMADGTVVRVPGLRIDDACAVRVGSWYVLPKLLNAPVTATIDTPTEVRRGTTLEYTVTMGKGFRGCPVYGQRLATGAWRLPDSYHHLNCRRVGPDRYEMRLEVPTDLAPGVYLLSWTAVMPDGEVVIADMRHGGVDVKVV